MAFPKIKWMKPETIERRKRQRIEEGRKRTLDLIRRLEEKVSAEGAESIWAEMLEETKQRNEEMLKNS